MSDQLIHKIYRETTECPTCHDINDWEIMKVQKIALNGNHKAKSWIINLHCKICGANWREAWVYNK